MLPGWALAALALGRCACHPASPQTASFMGTMSAFPWRATSGARASSMTSSPSFVGSISPLPSRWRCVRMATVMHHSLDDLGMMCDRAAGKLYDRPVDEDDLADIATVVLLVSSRLGQS